MAKGELWFRNSHGGLFKVTSKSLQASRNYKKSKKLQELNKQIKDLERKASNTANGAKSERSVNKLYKLDEQIKDLKAEANSKKSIKKPKKPDIYDKSKSKRTDDFYKEINKLSNNKSLTNKQKVDAFHKAVKKSRKPSKVYKNKKNK